MKKLKVLTVVGTRPEIIRLSRVLAQLDALRPCAGAYRHSHRFGGSGFWFRAQCDRNKRLWLNDQRSQAMFTYPSVHDVGIDAVLQSNSSNGRAGLRACLDNMQLEFRTVEPALGDLGGASFARHGVHDVHRAHYLNLFAVLQDGMPSRLPCWEVYVGRTHQAKAGGLVRPSDRLPAHTGCWQHKV